MNLRLLALSVIVLISPNTFAGLEKLIGEAYDLESDELLYREYHQFEYSDGVLQSGTVEYRLPDGELIGSKQLDYRPSLNIPAFRTELYDGRYIEGLKYVEGEIVIFRRKGEDAEEKSKTLKAYSAMAADAGFNNYVRQRFDDLMSGKEVQFRFIAPSQMAAVKFDATHVGERQIANMPVVEFKVEISSFLSLFVDPLQLSYDPDTRELIEYRGLSNVRDSEGDLYKVRIRYPQLIRSAAAGE